VSFCTYMLRCSDGMLYVGHTDNLDLRLAQHQSGEFGGWTRSRRPVELIWHQHFATRQEALNSEIQIKGWSRTKKLSLVSGDWDGVSVLGSRSLGSKQRKYAGQADAVLNEDEERSD
jgi:tRNA/rRNA methyltransferase